MSEAEHAGAAKTEAAGDADSARAPAQGSRARRVVYIRGAALAAVVLPVVLLYLLLGELGSRAMVMGLLP